MTILSCRHHSARKSNPRKSSPAWPGLGLAAILAATGFAGVPALHGGGAAGDPHAVVHGMTVSCSGAGRVWGSDEMVRTLEELDRLGVNWITIHPYAGIRADGTVGGGRLARMYDNPIWLTRPIREAHRLGMKIMIKPHIAYWGSPFGWRGEIEFDSDEKWQRFFDTYERWITRVAELCRDADAFAVGTELDRTVRHEQRWRQVIAAVREKIEIPLTYSASWDRYERVPFWDALDVIGIQAYFPVAEDETLPTPRGLDDTWSSLMRRLETFAGRHGRKIVFGELGYNRSSLAAVRPWEYRTGGEQAEEIQRRCLDAALRAMERSDVVVGAFLWKWFPGGGRWHTNFLKSTPAMREVIADHWSGSLEPSTGPRPAP